MKYVEFYNKSFKKWLKDNNIKIYWIYNERKFVVAERFMRTLKQIYNHMTGVLKNVYFDVLNDTVDRYNIITVLKWSLLMLNLILACEYNVVSNAKDPKSKIGNHVRISRYINILAKGYAPYWSEEVFVISKIRDTVDVINDLNGEEIVGTFYERKLQKNNQ